MKTFTEKKIRRKIAKASKRGRYVVGRRGSRARPGRSSVVRCFKCGTALGKLATQRLCDECFVKQDSPTPIMHIPTMSKK